MIPLPQIRTILQRTLRNNLFLTFNEIGKKPPVFVEATAIAHTILNSGLEFDTAEIIYNRFKSAPLTVCDFWCTLLSLVQECDLVPDNSSAICSPEDPYRVRYTATSVVCNQRLLYILSHCPPLVSTTQRTC